ncbi:MAG: RNA polymerase sigma factor [Phycisphaerales bacterium JB050]
MSHLPAGWPTSLSGLFGPESARRLAGTRLGADDSNTLMTDHASASAGTNQSRAPAKRRPTVPDAIAAPGADATEAEQFEYLGSIAERRGYDEQETEELALLLAYRRGDRSALAKLLEMYQDRLFAICVRMVTDKERARDLLQDAMVRIIQGLEQYSGRSRLSTWMIRVTMNACLTDMRRQRIRKTVSLDVRKASSDGRAGIGGGSGASLASKLFDSSEQTAAEAVQREELRADLYSAFERLDPSHRAMLILRDMHGLEYSQIAEALEIPEGTVKSRLFRARAALRDMIEQRMWSSEDR